jgi:hypothetical protein
VLKSHCIHVIHYQPQKAAQKDKIKKVGYFMQVKSV